MYGTVARVRVKRGAEEELMALAREVEGANVPGWVAEYVYRMESDPNVFYMAVVFESKDAYLANAANPEQDARYRKFAALLEEDPEWHDGEVVYAYPGVPNRR